MNPAQHAEFLKLFNSKRCEGIHREGNGIWRKSELEDFAEKQFGAHGPYVRKINKDVLCAHLRNNDFPPNPKGAVAISRASVQLAPRAKSPQRMPIPMLDNKPIKSPKVRNHYKDKWDPSLFQSKNCNGGRGGGINSWNREEVDNFMVQRFGIKKKDCADWHKDTLCDFLTGNRYFDPANPPPGDEKFEMGYKTMPKNSIKIVAAPKLKSRSPSLKSSVSDDSLDIDEGSSVGSVRSVRSAKSKRSKSPTFPSFSPVTTHKLKRSESPTSPPISLGPVTRRSSPRRKSEYI